MKKAASDASRTQDKAGNPEREAKLAELREMYSEETWRCAEESLQAKYSRTRDLLRGGDISKVDRWASQWLRAAQPTLPATLRGPGGQLLGIEDSKKRCVGFLQKVGRLGWEQGDQGAFAPKEKEIRSYLDKAATPEERRRRWKSPQEEDGPYSFKELDKAEQRIREGAMTIMIPNAAHMAPLPSWKGARLAAINLARDLETSAETINSWLINLRMKPGKKDTAEVANHRAIGLGHARARTGDELRMARLERQLMDYAGEQQRYSRADSLQPVILKVEVMAIRIFKLRLPLVHPKGDVEQGFPSSRALLLLWGAKRAGVGPKDLIQLHEESRLRWGKARIGEGVTETYHVQDGAEQGRRKNPALFCALSKTLADAARRANQGVGLDVPAEVAKAVRLEGHAAGASRPPDKHKAKEIAAELKKSLAEGVLTVSKAREEMRKAEDGATRLMAADLTATVRVGAAHFMDDFDSYQSREGGAGVTAEAVGEEARGIGQIFKEGKNNALACGFRPEKTLQIQGKEMPWADAVQGLGVWVDKNLNFEKHIAVMRAKATAALATVATAAELAELRWDDYIKVVPQRVESRALYGQELVVINENAPARLNATQREWGAALFGFFAGAPLYTEVAGWKLLVELGWRGRQWHRAAIKAVMAEERAWASDWETLHAVLKLSQEVDGGWLRAVQKLRGRCRIPPRHIAPDEESKSKGAVKFRLNRYREEQVEPRVYKEAEEEVQKE